MDKFNGTEKLKDLIANDYRLLLVMNRFGLTFGFGEKTISEVCNECGVDMLTFLSVVNYVKNGVDSSTLKISNICVKSLLSYLRKAHSYFLDYQLPTMRRDLLNSIDCSEKNEIAFLMLKFYDEYVEEVRKHMEYEENNVFVYVQRLLEGEHPTGDNMHLLSTHHEQIEGKLRELKNLFMQYYPQKGNNNELNSVLIDIYGTEEDLNIHCMVEDNLFLPAVRILEKKNRKNQKERKENVVSEESSSYEYTALSEREKEIVTCVAKGLSNKEIADLLYLSVNTVTTHRRNIARKLNIHSSAGITIYAIVNKLVTLDEVNI